MFIPVLYISSLIHIFSTDYMSQDPHNQRFFSYLSLFTFFMLLLVSGANYFVMFVGLFFLAQSTLFEQYDNTTICWNLYIKSEPHRLKKLRALPLPYSRHGYFGDRLPAHQHASQPPSLQAVLPGSKLAVWQARKKLRPR